jgi:hypothetical protein
MALQSNADLPLLNGRLPVSSVFDLFQFCIYHHLFVRSSTLLFGRPPSQLPWGLSLITLLTFLVLSILLTLPIESNRLILINELT